MRKLTREEQLEYQIDFYLRLLNAIKYELNKVKIELENLRGKGRIRK